MLIVHPHKLINPSIKVKHAILALLLFVVALTAGAQTVHHKNTKSTVYYVVVASFETLQDARDFNNNGPADTVCGNIYQAQAKGKTVYRVVESCYYSEAKAKQKISLIADYFHEWRGLTPWIWRNKGEAHCIERGMGNDGNYISTRPQ